VRTPLSRPHSRPGFGSRRVLAALLVLMHAPPVRAQEGALATVLTQVRASTVLAGAGAQVWRQLVALGGISEGPDGERVYAAVAEAFTLHLLLDDVAEVLGDAPPAGALEAVAAFLSSGATGALQRAMDARPPSGSIDDYMDEILVTRPPRSRSELVLRWTEAQGAPDFYLLVGESAREAALQILDAAFNADHSALRTPPEELLELREGIQAGAFLSFMRQLDGAPDEQIAASAAEYETEAGRWFVERYRVAVAVALRRGGERAAQRLEMPGGGL